MQGRTPNEEKLTEDEIARRKLADLAAFRAERILRK